MKIGLVALSGLRAVDPQLLELGMGLPGVKERERVVAALPSLGLLYLAAVTPAEHEVRYFEVPSVREADPAIFECDLVGLSTLTAQALDAYWLADRLREAGVTVVLGGLHASVLPHEAAEHADHVVVGEGERVWPELLRAVEAGELGRIWRAAEWGLVDLANLPVPRYDLLQPRHYQRYPVQTSRGCPWRCDFCASGVMLDLPYRKRPVGQVVRDVRAIQEISKRPFLELADDNTFVDKAWGRELCAGLAECDVSWFTETDISVADDETLLDAMRAARCRQVLIGLESPVAEGLAGIELKRDFKAARWAEAEEAVRRIQGHGITVNGCFILGLDGHTPAIFEQVLEFAERVPLYDVQLTVMTPFPGTPLYDRLEAEGRLLYPGEWDRCTLFDVIFRPAKMTPEQLREGLHWLAAELYTEEGVRRRRRPFHVGS